MTATEYVILVDEQDRAIGQAPKLLAHEQNLLHRAFSIFLFRKKEQWELLLQQRAFTKYHSGGLWTNTCCSHPRMGEEMVEAGVRRLAEELNIRVELTDVGYFHYNAHFSNGLSENEVDHVLVGFVQDDIDIQLNPAEVHACRWVSLEALDVELIVSPQQFTPWFKEALKMAMRICSD